MFRRPRASNWMYETEVDRVGANGHRFDHGPRRGPGSDWGRRCAASSPRLSGTSSGRRGSATHVPARTAVSSARGLLCASSCGGGARSSGRVSRGACDRWLQTIAPSWALARQALEELPVSSQAVRCEVPRISSGVTGSPRSELAPVVPGDRPGCGCGSAPVVAEGPALHNGGEAMRRLLSLADASQIERFRKELFRAGIPVQVRHSALMSVLRGKELHPELWVRDDGDFVRASRLLAHWREPDLAPVGSAEGSPEIVKLEELA